MVGGRSRCEYSKPSFGSWPALSEELCESSAPIQQDLCFAGCTFVFAEFCNSNWEIGALSCLLSARRSTWIFNALETIWKRTRELIVSPYFGLKFRFSKLLPGLPHHVRFWKFRDNGLMVTAASQNCSHGLGSAQLSSPPTWLGSSFASARAASCPIAENVLFWCVHWAEFRKKEFQSIASRRRLVIAWGFPLLHWVTPVVLNLFTEARYEGMIENRIYNHNNNNRRCVVHRCIGNGFNFQWKNLRYCVAAATHSMGTPKRPTVDVLT